MDQHEAIASLYRRNLSNPQVEKNFLIADCPFCREKGFEPQGWFVVFLKAGVEEDLLAEQGVGFNGRYLVYPYVQEDGNCYAARCVFPGRKSDFFWHGDETTFAEKSRIFNVQDIGCCENGSLFLCVGEDNLLTLKQLGYPGVAVPDYQNLENIDPQQFAFIKTLFLVTTNSGESDISMRKVASRIGYKVRPFKWPVGLPKDYTLWQLAKDKGKKFRGAVSALIKGSSAFSPFATPAREYDRFSPSSPWMQGPLMPLSNQDFPCWIRPWTVSTGSILLVVLLNLENLCL